MECSDFRNVTFEKISLAPFEVIQVKRGSIVKEWDFEAEKIQTIKENEDMQFCFSVFWLFSCYKLVKINNRRRINQQGTFNFKSLKILILDYAAFFDLDDLRKD